MSAPIAALAAAADRPELEALRHRVFVEEQAVPPDLERDELDDAATHAVARGPDGRLVGTGRVVVEPGGAVARIGRMAVAPEARGRGVGGAVLAVLEAAAAAAGCGRAVLHAQLQAEGFYRRAGYAREGEPFEEAGIPHVVMARPLAPTQGDPSPSLGGRDERDDAGGRPHERR